MGLWGCEQILRSAEKEELQMCVSQIFPWCRCWLRFSHCHGERSGQEGDADSCLCQHASCRHRYSK